MDPQLKPTQPQRQVRPQPRGPMQRAQSQPVHTQQFTSESYPPQSRLQPAPSNKRRIGLIIAAIVVGLLIVAAALFYIFLSNGVDKDKYQAVFLTNGQAYFGSLHDYGSDNPYMTDVYYFQSPDTTKKDAAEPAQQTIVKLGDEIHKPEDKLILNQEAILFVENLSGEGSVAQAIKENQ